MLLQGRNSNYQFYSPWFDPTGNRTQNLPHLRQARQQLHDSDDLHVSHYTFSAKDKIVWVLVNNFILTKYNMLGI